MSPSNSNLNRWPHPGGLRLGDPGGVGTALAHEPLWSVGSPGVELHSATTSSATDDTVKVTSSPHAISHPCCSDEDDDEDDEDDDDAVESSRGSLTTDSISTFKRSDP